MHISNYRYLATFLCRVATAGLIMLGLVITVPASHAQTADGITPAEETVCDGQTEALWGLCTAYCEAMDCDSESPLADETACERVFTNYYKKSGGAMPPCEPAASAREDTDAGESEECFEGCGDNPSSPPAA